MDELQRAAARARAWLFESALPLWEARGVDPEGAFYERLAFSGEPDVGAVRRMRVQARQLYVFAQAQQLGWRSAGFSLERSFDVFLRRCWASDGRPGWIHTLTPVGEPADGLRDAYDHAFALFALAQVFTVCGDARAREAADRTLAFLDERLADPVHGGFAEDDRGSLPRRSNPHMHLLEAMLAWFAATGDETFAERARVLIRLFDERFYEPATGTLGEYFTPDLRPLEGEAGVQVEPGHHFEWSWLLSWAAELGVADRSEAACALHAFGRRHGLDANGFAVDLCDRSGRVLSARRRAWPQTELLKAELAAAARGDLEARGRAAAAAHRILDRYLDTAAPGLWTDHFDEQGRPCVDTVPASTFYHLVLAFRELMAAADRSGS